MQDSLFSWLRRLRWSCFEGNAKLEGLTTQLNLTGNTYNVALVRMKAHPQRDGSFMLATSRLCFMS